MRQQLNVVMVLLSICLCLEMYKLKKIRLMVKKKKRRNEQILCAWTDFVHESLNLLYKYKGVGVLKQGQ